MRSFVFRKEDGSIQEPFANALLFPLAWTTERRNVSGVPGRLEARRRKSVIARIRVLCICYMGKWMKSMKIVK